MSFKVSPPIADRLLDLLSEDDDFRRRFEADAVGCLAELGCVATTDETGAGPWCMATKHLAPKAVIRETRQALRRQLVEQIQIYNAIGLSATWTPTAAMDDAPDYLVDETIEQH